MKRPDRMVGLLAAVVASACVAWPAGAAAPAQQPQRPARPAPAQTARPDVDLKLVIATDGSGSIDRQEAYLQRKGISDAFRSREVINAIRNGSLGKIAVVYVSFSSRFYNHVVVDWRVIGDEAGAIAYADHLMRVPLTRGRGTSISDAIEYSMGLLEKNPLRATKQTIDISGDGPNNQGRPILEVRDEARAKGITINGLPIMDPNGFDQSADLDKYFTNCVIGGPGSFIQVAQGFPDFSRAIRRKLVLEISDASETDYAQTHALLHRAAAQATPNVVPVRPQIAPRAPMNYECY